ncbi:GTPase [Gregarina niphandrodes]|uniref:GTPase n=1 Tax=Gregarina niphandrodes TaxID=110365 RepID=A0A023BA40_GRENI|nr:GTPase [Gregarina niphandrodes]EZG77295.1 GTPase [Gregarina niphandrodes]|eukprot:XP_011129517.1 GTPase [Gregarina niphandrodes]
MEELEDDDGYDDGDGDGDGDGQRDGSSRDSSRDEEDLSKLNLLDLSREKLRQRDHQGGEQRVVPRSGGSSSKSPESEVVLSLAAAEDWEGVLSMSQLRAHLETLGVQVREKQSAKRLRCLQILGALENKLASSASIHDEFCDYLAENAARHIEELHSGAQTRSKVLPHSVLPHSVLPHSARDKTRTGRDKTRTGRSMVIRLLGSIDAQSPLVVVGTTGFPNVGKSSLINTLMEGTARVGVSRTPGKTRHIQTLQVPNSFLTLCDCPGLVMPTAACSKESLVINGIMNVDTYRGTVVRPVSHVLLRTGEQIAEIYGVTHTFNSLFGTEALHEKALPILNLLASCKGYYTGTKGAVPDVERVGRMLVKQYLEGKLISYCEVAPNADVDAWRHEEQTKWASRKQKWRQHRQKSNQLTVTEKGMKPKKINASGRVIPPRPS